MFGRDQAYILERKASFYVKKHMSYGLVTDHLSDDRVVFEQELVAFCFKMWYILW
jgi:hypothetical protein